LEKGVKKKVKEEKSEERRVNWLAVSRSEENKQKNKRKGVEEPVKRERINRLVAFSWERKKKE